MATAVNLASVILIPTITQVSTANTARDGTGTAPVVATGAGSGTTGVNVIKRATITATGTTTAGMVRFFLSADNGSTKRLLCEVQVTAYTVSATQAAFTAEVNKLVGIELVANANIYASTHNAETFNIHVEMGQT